MAEKDSGGGAHDAWFFVGIFVFIFLIWAATGGPVRPISFAGPTLAQPEELGGGAYLQFPRAPATIGRSNVVLPGSSDGRSIPNTPVTPPPTIIGGIFGNPSPFQSSVRMDHYVSNASSSNARSEYVQIHLAQNAPAPVTLTGWRLMSGASGRSEIIPRGTQVPTSGFVNAAEDIVLRPGETAIIVSGESPVGASFRENKCIGYFGTFQQFSPSLPFSCPVPSSELAAFFGEFYINNPTCIDYVDTLSRCQVPMPTPTTQISSRCRTFLENYLNYNGCVAVHRNDANFHGNTWRIYLGREYSLWRTRHEIVRLLDAQGRTIDTFSY